MRKVILLGIFALTFWSLKAQTIVGGAGVCHVDQDPDNITAMQTQDERGDCLIAWDNVNQALYVYDAGQTITNRWTAVPLSAVTDTDLRLDNPTVNGANLEFDVYDVQGTAIVGTESVAVIDIAPVQSIVAGTGISVNNVAGAVTVTNDSPDQTVTLGAGSTGVTIGGVYPAFTVSVDDQSITNEAQTATVAFPTGSTASFSIGDANGAGGGTMVLVEGTGIDISDNAGQVQIANSAPDQTVTLTEAGGTTITGTYPNFTISSATGDTADEGILGVDAGASFSSVITSNTTGANGVTLNVSGPLTIGETVSSNGGAITLTALNESQALTHDYDIGNTFEINLAAGGGGGGGAILVLGGDGITIADNGGNPEISSTQFASVVADSHADAGTSGVAIGDYFYASIANEMGVTPGTKIRRMY